MNQKDKVKAFCLGISDDIDKEISLSSDDSESSVLLDTYKAKCKAVLDDVSGQDEKTWKGHVNKILRDISQLVLDVTYVKEIQLVDDDFTQDSAETDIKGIIETLSSLEVLAETVCPEEDVLTCLGPEIVECLQWRKGALLYMFCHIVHYRNPDKGIPHHQQHYLEEGAGYLVSMLKTRSDAKWMDSSRECQNDDDTDTLQLIEQGIFSDTHLLALMYCGEMCYWFTSSCDKSSSCTQHAERTTKIKAGTENVKRNEDLDLKKTCESEYQKTAESASDISRKVSQGADSRCHSKGEKVIKSDDTSVEIDIGDKCPSNLQNSSSNQVESNISTMVNIGNLCLKKYVSVAQGPLAASGWNTERAEDIIGHFQKLKL